jgi:hypothetical protein
LALGLLRRRRAVGSQEVVEIADWTETPRPVPSCVKVVLPNLMGRGSTCFTPISTGNS